MKKTLFIAVFMVVGLMQQVCMGIVHLNAEQAQNILNRISEPTSDDWEPTGPTAEDIRSATKVEKQAVKGSLEDKLINAVKNGDLKNVEAFIAAGADLEARDNQDMTALMRAAEKGHSDIFRVLMNAGADLNAQNKFKCKAFFWAADNNHLDIVKILVAQGAVDENFDDILMRATYQGNTKMVKALNKEAK
jgi:ankyrin repeat protein